MGFHKTILVHEVLCDETFAVGRVNNDISIGSVSIPCGSTITEETCVNVLKCEPIIDIKADHILVQVALMVQEELTATTPGGETYPLEFAFRMQAVLHYTCCVPSSLGLTCLDSIDTVECRAKITSITNQITLHPSSPNEAANASFDQTLCIKINIKLLREIQLQMCIPAHPCKCRTQNCPLGVITLNDLTMGALIGILGSSAFAAILFLAYMVGKRRGGGVSAIKDEEEKTVPPTTRRIPTKGSSIPPGAVAQTQFVISGSKTASKK